MKRLFAIAGLVVLTVSISMAQQRVVLESGDTTTTFGGANAFVNAYNAASDGDTLYLPGLQFSVPNPFEKQLTIYGAGYHPDHTAATGQTQLNGNLNVHEGAQDSHFEGIFFRDSISFQAAKIDNVTFIRCYFLGTITLNGLDAETRSENIRFIECIIRNRFNGRRSSRLVFKNNVLINNSNDLFVNIHDNALIMNNVFVGRGWQQFNAWPYRRYVMDNITESLFENNIIYNTQSTSYTFTSVDNNTFNNNVFSYDPTNAGNTWNDNYTGINIVEFFVNYTGDAFDFEADYNLVDPESYQGTTGNQVGIYGGHNPFKANTRPSNPQILSVEIGHGTDDEGMLHVELQVEAQEQ